MVDSGLRTPLVSWVLQYSLENIQVLAHGTGPQQEHLLELVDETRPPGIRYVREKLKRVCCVGRSFAPLSTSAPELCTYRIFPPATHVVLADTMFVRPHLVGT
jgi:hypothetical protein